MSEYITKEQFGVDLFNAVFIIGQILAERNKARLYKEQGNQYARKAAQKEAHALQTQLHTHMDKLSDADAAEIVRRYPWVLQGVTSA